MSTIRVMQSFGEPRSTTNPYIVQLRDCLVAAADVDHLPFSWRTALIGKYDLFHVHWPDTLLDGRSVITRAGKRAAFALLLARLRLQRIPVVRTVHNLAEPRGGRVDRALVAALGRRVTLRIRINESTPEVEGTPSALILHGHYRNWYRDFSRAEPTAGRLGYVGLIKPYKGVEALVAAFEQTGGPGGPAAGVTLDIQGKPADEQTAQWLRAEQERVAGLSITLRYIDEEEFVTAVTSAAVLVLPYKHLHNSGAVLAALSLDRPVLVPDGETARALADEVGATWVRTFSGELTAADLLSALEAPAPSTGPDLSQREWSGAAAQHSEAYRRAILARLAPRSSTNPLREETSHA